MANGNVLASKSRILAIDAMRAIALAAMALDHAAASVWVSLQAETYGGQAAVLASWPYWVTGLFTNIAAHTFWLLSGASIALFAEGRRRQGISEAGITRHLLIRSAVIIFLDLTICQLFWAGNGPYLHVLLSIGIGLAIISIIRLLPDIVLGGLLTFVLVGYQLLLPTWGVQFSQTNNFILAVLFTYSTRIWPAVEFSTFGWATLMGFGFLLGQRISSPRFRSASNWFLIGLGLMGLWLVLRLMGGFGDLTHYLADQPWYLFLIMSKTPPSLTYLAFNLGISAFAIGILVKAGPLLERKPFSWVVATGQVSLFFFVLHIVIYGILGRVFRLFALPLPGVAIAIFVWGLGLVLMLPITVKYRDLRKRYPQSLLKYL